MKKIAHSYMLFFVIGLVGCAGSPVDQIIQHNKYKNAPQAKAPSGYELVTIRNDGYKYYAAPASKSTIILERKNPVSGVVEKNPYTSISLFIAWPAGNGKKSEYRVNAYACALQAGTYIKQSDDLKGWDKEFTTVAFGTTHWRIWNYVCNGVIEK